MDAATSARSDSSRAVGSWWRLWAIAVLAHIVTNAGGDHWTFESIINTLAGTVAIVVIVRPGDRRWRTALVVVVPMSAFAEAPALGNHWLLAAAVSLVALAAQPWRSDSDFWSRFAPSARILLLVFYSFAAFAKLNTGFFDPVTSCARYLANGSLSFWQLPEVSGSSPIATLLPYLTAAIELSVPVLLIVPRTRRLGVLLAIGFHLFLTVDLLMHFFDFTLVLIPLFLLFAEPDDLERLDSGWPRLQAFGGIPWIGIGMYMVLVSSLPVSNTVRGSGLVMSWGMWLIVGVIITRSVVLPLFARTTRPSATDKPAPMSLKPVGIAAFFVIALMVLNGLSPYLELKSATGFNMYSNLSTMAGETNHFLVPRTLEVRGDQSQLATIVSTDSEDLSGYLADDLSLPITNLRSYLAANPDISISFEYAGELITLERAGDHPEWLDAQPWYVERLLLFRAVPSDEVQSCQLAWLPAR
jgi:hypothetical protein